MSPSSLMRKAGLTALACSLVVGSAMAVPAYAADSFDGVEEEIASALESRGIPGAQVVYRNGATGDDFSYTYGVQSVQTGAPVTPETLFQAASLTKVVASYVVLQLVDEGVLDLDTPLWEYYESPRIADNDQSKTVTARMVLNHSTGFPNWAGAVNSLETPLVPSFTPGTEFGYSGDGFFLLQNVVEHLTGSAFAELMEERVFTPFGMERSTLASKPENVDSTAMGHNVDGVPDGFISNYTPGNVAYTLQTTASEYASFLQAAVIDGEGLSPETHAEWLAQSSDAGDGITWGLGIGRESNEHGDAVWHWGDNGTRKAFFMVYPETNEVVTMFWNSQNGQRSAGDILSLFYPDTTFLSLPWVGDVDEEEPPVLIPEPTVPSTDGWSALAEVIAPIIEEASAAGVDLGVAVQDLTGYYDGQALYQGKLDRFTTASTIKLSLAAAVMSQVESGELSLDDVFTITEDERYGGSGTLQNNPFPQDVTVGEMLDLMITVSDNTATNKLVDVVGGYDAINGLTEAAGISLGDLHFGRKMFGPVVPPLGDVWLTPYGMNQLLGLLFDTAEGRATEGFLSAESAQHIIDLMSKQQVKTKLGAVIPADVLAHKTGENDTVSHDVGYLLVPGQQITLAVFSTAGEGFEGDLQTVAVPFVQRVGKAVYDYVLATAPEEKVPGGEVPGEEVPGEEVPGEEVPGGEPGPVKPIVKDDGSQKDPAGKDVKALPKELSSTGSTTDWALLTALLAILAGGAAFGTSRWVARR